MTDMIADFYTWLDIQNASFGMLALYYVLLMVFFAVYAIPIFVAFYKQHSKKNLLMVTNIFTGWTVVGWIGCMVWAFVTD